VRKLPYASLCAQKLLCAPLCARKLPCALFSAKTLRIMPPAHCLASARAGVMQAPEVMSIGAVAARCGVAAWQVRNLFRRSLLPEPPRGGPFRIFSETDLPAIEAGVPPPRHPPPPPAGGAAGAAARGRPAARLGPRPGRRPARRQGGGGAPARARGEGGVGGGGPLGGGGGAPPHRRGRGERRGGWGGRPSRPWRSAL